MKLTFLLSMAMLCCWVSAQAQETYTGPFHIETKPVKRVQAKHTVTFRAPQLQAHEWIVFAAEPPTLPGQTDILIEMSFPARETTDLSPLHRPVLNARIPVTNADLRSGITIATLTEITLSERKLVAGAPLKPVPALSQEAHSAATIFTPTVDYSQPEFQAWLTAKNLRRQTAETVIAFAHRVYLQIAENYTYKSDSAQDRRASALCKTGATDCGGVVCLFVATLRANDIPARALVGRWATTSKGDVDFGMTHVKSEFFATGVGWIPVDVSGGVGNRQQVEKFFGNDPGDHITQHIDPDMILDTGDFGPQKIEWVQGILHWATGTGSSEGTETTQWQVQDLPLPKASAGPVNKPTK